MGQSFNTHCELQENKHTTSSGAPKKPQVILFFFFSLKNLVCCNLKTLASTLAV